MSDPLEEELAAYMRRKDYAPQDASGLARGMELDSAQRPALRALLKEWEAAGKIMRLRQARYILREVTQEALTGRIRRTSGGKYLFVPGEEACKSLDLTGCGATALPVRLHHEGGAQDGDLVRVIVRRENKLRFRHGQKRFRPTQEELQPSVSVEEVLERRGGAWVGIYRARGRYGVLQGDGRSCPEQVPLAEPPPPGLLDGMCVSAQMIAAPQGRNPGSAKVTEVLGWPEDEGVDMKALIRRYTLRDAFPEAVLAETLALPAAIPTEETARREDWRRRCVITIDPATARDFDDAISVRRDGQGWELAVHIADVSYYVRPGSALDEEARLRGNSTYLPDRVLPMLPPRLCDDLCSLRPDEDRLTRLCLMQVDAQGRVTGARLQDAVIRSRCRLNYATALAVLENRGTSGQEEVDAMLREAHKLARLLRQRRMEAYAMDFQLPELRVILDDHGHPTGVETESTDEAHRLIEEFMLAANESVARALRGRLVPTIYRVHEEPDPAKLHEFSLTLRQYGIAAGTLATREELYRVMQQLQGHRDEQLLTTALLRSMMRARYSPNPLGHFGLAKGDYCHFTSPIRRYADLIVHRSFSRLSKGSATPRLPDAAGLAAVAEHISETERNSAAAENEAQQLKLMEFIQAQCDSPAPQAWDGIVTGAWPQGLSVEIPALRLRGFVSGSDLENPTAYVRWYYERHASRWSSTDGRSILPGAKIRLIPTEVDAASRFVNFRPC